jgi:hypothetical protein
MKRFNTAGPCIPEWHYMVPTAERLPEIRQLVRDNAYFVVHAPRQSGKTTTLMALCRELTEAGTHTALHFSCEAGEAAGDDYKAAEAAIIDTIVEAASNALPEALRPPAPSARRAAGSRLGAFLTAWAKQSPRPIALVFDEIDALRGMSLITVLRQLRAGFPNRPKTFPASVILCGLRDVRDYKTAAGGDASRLGTSSPFNVKVESLTLAAFTRSQVTDLLGQHTAETGQAFAPDAVDRAFEMTRGQPWLLNALANEVVVKMAVPLSEPITAAHINRAKERLIVARATHLDSLVAKLMEPRVRSVLMPILTGLEPDEVPAAELDSYDDDRLYVADLGLVAPDAPLRIANPIYREVIFRVLSGRVEDRIDLDRRRFVAADGRLDMGVLLSEFMAFWVEHGAALVRGGSYHEIAAQLVLMAWLHRIINGGGYVAREVGVGRGRIDVLVTWPFTDADGKQASQREALELKVWAPGRPDPLAKGLKQLDGYLASLSLDHGVLALFDRRPDAGLPEDRSRVERAVTESGRAVTVLRL